MNVKDYGPNLKPTGSTLISPEVPRILTEPGHPMIDKVRDGVEHLNVLRKK